MQIVTLALQFNGLLLVVLVAAQWIVWNGFFDVFDLSPDAVGISTASLFFEGMANFLPCVILFTGWVYVETVRARLPGRRYQVALVGLIATFLVFISLAFISRATIEIRTLNAAVIAVVCPLPIVAAVAMVRRTSRTSRIAVIVAILSIVGGASTAHLLGRANGESVVTEGRALDSRNVLGLVTRRFVAVRQNGNDTAPTWCGLLLGTSDGSFVVWYPDDTSHRKPASEVWRLPVDTTVLDQC
jgi:hypothetical protein